MVLHEKNKNLIINKSYYTSKPKPNVGWERCGSGGLIVVIENGIPWVWTVEWCPRVQI